jgi:hypothetical protein
MGSSLPRILNQPVCKMCVKMRHFIYINTIITYMGTMTYTSGATTFDLLTSSR